MSSSLKDILHFAIASSAFFLYGYLEVTHQRGFLVAIVLASYFTITGKASTFLSWLTVVFHLGSRFLWESPPMALMSFLVLDVLYLFQTTPKSTVAKEAITSHVPHHTPPSTTKTSPGKKNKDSSHLHRVSPKQKKKHTTDVTAGGDSDPNPYHPYPSLDQPVLERQQQQKQQYTTEESAPPTPPSTPYQEYFSTARDGNGSSGAASMPLYKSLPTVGKPSVSSDISNHEFVTIPLGSLSLSSSSAEHNGSVQFSGYVEGHGKAEVSTPRQHTPKAKKRRDQEMIQQALDQAREQELMREQELLRRLQLQEQQQAF